MSRPASIPSDIHPSLRYDEAPAAIEWLCRAFGFPKRFVVGGPDNRVEHPELSLGTGVVMVSSPSKSELFREIIVAYKARRETRGERRLPGCDAG